MGTTVKKIFFSLIVSILYGVFTVCIVFYITPNLGAVPDYVWIGFMFIVPAIAVLPLIRTSWYPFPATIFIGIPVEYIILYINAEQVARYFAISIQGLGWFTYVFMATTRPIAVTLVQFLVIRYGRKIHSKRLPD